MTENDLEQLKQYGAMFAGDDDLTDERVDLYPSLLALSEIGDEQTVIDALVADVQDKLVVVQAAIIKQLEQRIAEMEAALMPFAQAAGDDDVQAVNDKVYLLLEDVTFGKHKPIYATPAKSVLLQVSHLRAAADALKGKTL